MTRKILLNVCSVGVCYRQRTGLLRYKNFWGLKDVSFKLYAGETLGIIGGNGAGKSTLLRLLAGIIEPDRGSIWRYPGVVASLLALNVGFRPELSGRENATLSGMLLGMKLADVTHKLEQIKTFSDLGDFFEEPVGAYSTGMRARLGFAVAIHADPDILLIDEVLGVGDESFRLKSQQAMRDKIKANKTVVLVSHSMEAIRELSDRVLWLADGRSMACGNAHKIIDGYFAAVKKAIAALWKKSGKQNGQQK